PVDSACVYVGVATTSESYTRSLHDALPIWEIDLRDTLQINIERRDEEIRKDVSICLFKARLHKLDYEWAEAEHWYELAAYYTNEDRKSTRLNSSHVKISYAVFGLKKKTISL